MGKPRMDAETYVPMYTKRPGWLRCLSFCWRSPPPFLGWVLGLSPVLFKAVVLRRCDLSVLPGHNPLARDGGRLLRNKPARGLLKHGVRTASAAEIYLAAAGVSWLPASSISQAAGSARRRLPNRAKRPATRLLVKRKYYFDEVNDSRSSPPVQGSGSVSFCGVKGDETRHRWHARQRHG